jgi:phage terminase Nu1 subunit (DNA packaging protein)
MNHEATTAELCNLFGASRETLSNLAKRSIIVRGTKRGTWLLQPSVSGYVKHLREEAAARGGEDAAAARARLGQAQADLATVKARKLAGELVEASEVEALWRSKLKAFRNRITNIPGRVQNLSARQTAVLQQELRAALEELADDKGA